MRTGLSALLVGLAVTTGLSLGHRSVGYVRDEGVYFEAARSYAGWLAGLLAHPAEALDGRARDRAFSINAEHPALMKLAFGTSARLLARPPVGAEDQAGLVPVLPEGVAMRLPAQAVAGAGAALLWWVGLGLGGVIAAVIAVGAFVLLPHVAFHGGLACFDVPVAVASLALWLLYQRALVDARAGLWLGPALGVAISIKHNALFLPALFGLHYLACLGHARFRLGLPIARAQLVPRWALSCAVLGPLVAVALWPWLWSHPLERIGEYFAFHARHSYYNMEFLGRNYNEPPMPVAYPFVMTWATVPSVVLVLALAGIAMRLREDLRAGRVDAAPAPAPAGSAVPLPEGWPRLPGLLLALMAGFPLVLIALPSTPIFGGTKHFLTAFPFLTLAAALAFTRLCDAAAFRPGLRSAAAAAVLLPGAIATVAGHPYGLSQYAPLVGGPRGAAELGLNRGFWGHAAPALLRALPATEAGGSPFPLYLHDLDALSMRQYQRDGTWPRGVVEAPLGRARAGLLFHERHMTTHETDAWNRFGTVAPAAVITLSDVPLTSLYAQPGP